MPDEALHWCCCDGSHPLLWLKRAACMNLGSDPASNPLVLLLPLPRCSTLCLQRCQLMLDARRLRVLAHACLQVTLDGLIEFTDEHAKFVVLGSKGNPYTILLKARRRGASACAIWQCRGSERTEGLHPGRELRSTLEGASTRPP